MAEQFSLGDTVRVEIRWPRDDRRIVSKTMGLYECVLAFKADTASGRGLSGLRFWRRSKYDISPHHASSALDELLIGQDFFAYKPPRYSLHLIDGVKGSVVVPPNKFDSHGGYLDAWRRHMVVPCPDIGTLHAIAQKLSIPLVFAIPLTYSTYRVSRPSSMVEGKSPIALMVDRRRAVPHLQYNQSQTLVECQRSSVVDYFRYHYRLVERSLAPTTILFPTPPLGFRNFLWECLLRSLPPI